MTAPEVRCGKCGKPCDQWYYVVDRRSPPLLCPACHAAEQGRGHIEAWPSWLIWGWTGLMFALGVAFGMIAARFLGWD